MRKNYMFLAAACVALGITACGQKKSETAPVPSTQTETAQESAAETETAETKESSQAEEEAEEKTVTGRVTGVEDTVITLSGQNDLEYQIDLADANTAGSLEVGEGDQIMVTFMDDDQEIKKAESYDILTSAAQEGEQESGDCRGNYRCRHEYHCPGGGKREYLSLFYLDSRALRWRQRNCGRRERGNYLSWFPARGGRRGNGLKSDY